MKEFAKGLGKDGRVQLARSIQHLLFFRIQVSISSMKVSEQIMWNQIKT